MTRVRFHLVLGIVIVFAVLCARPLAAQDIKCHVTGDVEIVWSGDGQAGGGGGHNGGPGGSGGSGGCDGHDGGTGDTGGCDGHDGGTGDTGGCDGHDGDTGDTGGCDGHDGGTGDTGGCDGHDGGTGGTGGCDGGTGGTGGCGGHDGGTGGCDGGTGDTGGCDGHDGGTGGTGGCDGHDGGTGDTGGCDGHDGGTGDTGGCDGHDGGTAGAGGCGGVKRAYVSVTAHADLATGEASGFFRHWVTKGCGNGETGEDGPLDSDNVHREILVVITNLVSDGSYACLLGECIYDSMVTKSKEGKWLLAEIVDGGTPALKGDTIAWKWFAEESLADIGGADLNLNAKEILAGNLKLH